MYTVILIHIILYFHLYSLYRVRVMRASVIFLNITVHKDTEQKKRALMKQKAPVFTASDDPLCMFRFRNGT